MEKYPIDYIIEKIVGELLKLEKISSISQNCLDCIVDLTKDYICEIGRATCIESIELSRSKPSINEVLLGIATRCSLLELCNYGEMKPLPTIYGYNFPNSSYQHIVSAPSPQINNDLPVFFKPIPAPHISKSSSILCTERDPDKAMNRKRLLEERRVVKRSICSINEEESELLEEMHGEKKHQNTRDEQLPTLPTNTSILKNPSRLPDMLSRKPMAFETINGVNVEYFVF